MSGSDERRVGRATPATLVGREDECGRLEALLAGARAGRAGILVLRGEAGIGKSSLLAYARVAADGFLVLACQPPETDDVPFAALGRLLGPLLVDGLDRLPAPQAAALASALDLGPASGGDRFAVATATLALLAQAADEQPLLLLVDDAQWLDDAVAEALLFSVRRLRAEPIAVLLAARDGTPGVARLAGLPELVVPGLTAAAAGELLAARGPGPLGSATLAALVADTGGNPLALLELPGLAPAGAVPPRLGERLLRAFGERFALLPAASRKAVLLVAASGAAGADVLGAALAASGLSAYDLEPAEVAGLIEVGAGWVGLPHPLVRAAAYQQAGADERRAAHAALAEALDVQPGPHAVERAVRHRAAAADGPDAAVSGRLEQAADAAAARRAYGAALELYEQAAALAPDPAEAARLSLQAAVMTLPSGRVDDAERLVEAVLAGPDDWRRSTEALHVRCRVEMWGGRPVTARDLLLRVADDVEPRDPVWAAVMLSHAALLSATLGQQPLAEATVTRAAGLCADLPDEWAMPVLLLLAFVGALGGQVERARALMTRCEPHLERWDPLASEQLLLVAAMARLSMEEPLEARRWFDRAVDAARAGGAVGLMPFQLSGLARLEWQVGRWDAAYVAAYDAAGLARETGWRTELPNSLLALALVEAGTGREQACREHCAEARALALQNGMDIMAARADTALGLLELGAGRPERAARYLGEVERFATASGVEDPLLLPWAGDLAEARVRAGQPGDAAGPLAVLEREAAASGRPTAVAVAARVRALLAEDDAVDSYFDEALAAHDRGSTPFERARTELCQGEHLLRTRRRKLGAAALQAALVGFERLGAAPWVALTRAALGGGGSEPRPGLGVRGLSPQELQVALVVAGGATNAEAAARLFLSPKTIEFHLSNVYRKLGLRSRSQLVRAMDRQPVPS